MHTDAVNALSARTRNRPRHSQLAAAITIGLLGAGSCAIAAEFPRLQDPQPNTLQPGPVRIQKIRSALPLSGTPSPSALILVTNLDDDGPGSLRQAILSANLTPFVHDEIRFDPSLAGGVLTLTSGSLLISSNMTIRNPSLVQIGITSAPVPPPAPSGTLPTTNDGRLFLIDDGNDEINSRVSFEGLDMFGAIVVDEVPVPEPNGVAGIDETTAFGSAILSAESVEIRRSQIRGNSNYSVVEAYAIGTVFAQGDLIVQDSTVSGNFVAAVEPVGGSGIALGPLAAFPNESTANPGETIRPAHLRIEHSTVQQNRTYAINSALAGTNVQAYPSTVVSGNANVSHSSLVGNAVAGFAAGAASQPFTQALVRSAAVVTLMGDLNVSDSRVSGNFAGAVGASALVYAGALAALSGESLDIVRSEVSENVAYAIADNNAGDSLALSYGAAAIATTPYATITDSTLANNQSFVDASAAIDGSAADATVSSSVYALGAATLLGTQVVIVNSTITGNSAQGRAQSSGTTSGAFNLSLTAVAQAWGGGLTLTGPAGPIAPSDALLGGGSFPLVVNSTVADNEAISETLTDVTGSTTGTLTRTEVSTARGGGIASLNSPFNLPGLGSVLLSGNSVSASASVPASTIELGPDVHGNAFPLSNNLIEDPTDSNIVDGVNGNIVGLTELEPLKHNGGPTRTRALVPGSLAIDAGFNPLFISNDQRGYGPRESGAAADIGAYECGTSPLPGDDEDLFIDDFDPSC